MFPIQRVQRQHGDMKSSHTTEVQEVQNGFNTRKPHVMTRHMRPPSPVFPVFICYYLTTNYWQLWFDLLVVRCQMCSWFNARRLRLIFWLQGQKWKAITAAYFGFIFDRFREVEVRGPYFTDVHVPHSPRQIHTARFTRVNDSLPVVSDCTFASRHSESGGVEPGRDKSLNCGRSLMLLQPRGLFPLLKQRLQLSRQENHS